MILQTSSEPAVSIFLLPLPPASSGMKFYTSSLSEH